MATKQQLVNGGSPSLCPSRTLELLRCGVGFELPGWVKDDATSVREEVAEWADTTPAERWRLAMLCARDAMWAARASGHLERVLDHVEPLPESTVRALARLRRAAGWGHAHR